MASEVDIVNAGLTLLGESRITSLDDRTKPAREAKALYSIARDALLAAYNWNFAKARIALPALVGAPPFQFANKFQLPSDCLRLIMLNDYYVGIDLTDYRGAPTQEFELEGREILTSWSAPLNIKYVKRVTDTQQFDPCFIKALGCQLAMDLCEALTQSDTKYQKAERQFGREVSNAVRVNAIALPPQKLPDDEWIMSRL